MASQTTTVGEIEICWEEFGAGAPALVLAHGYTGAHQDFDDHFEALAGDRRVIGLDHRGHGGSTNVGAGGYGLDRLAADLVGFLEAVAEGPVDLLGHSMGGMIALRAVLQRPDLMRSLILMDTAAESIGGAPLAPAVADKVRERGLSFIASFTPPTPERDLIRDQKGAPWQERDQAERLGAMDPEAFIGLYPEVFDGPSLLDQIPKISCPTTIIVGEHDAPFRGPSDRMAAAIPGTHLEVIDGAYHSPQRTHPEPWRAAVAAHLARVEKRA